MITIDPPSRLQPPRPTPSKPALTRFLNRARAAVRLPGTVDVLLTSDAELKRLNRIFRGKNKPTDVLSFPADPIPGLPSIHRHAGDLAVSLDTASRQATLFGHSLDLELRILLLHGLLHLAGHDHETDSGEMAALEADFRSTLKLPASLIARTLNPRPLSSRTRTPASTLSARPKRSAAERHASPATTLKPKPRGGQ